MLWNLTAIHQIKSLETQARGILRFLRSLRNTFQPVNRLPPEIISHIVRSILDGAIDTRSIVPLTHVCRYWRNTFISTPDNWSLISNEWEGLAVLSLERAKVAPLTIHLDMYKLDPTKHPRFRELLLSRIQYTRFLSVTTPSTNKLVQTFPNFTKSMPGLQSLALESNERADWTLPDPFDLSAHTLKSLTLRGILLYPSFLSIRTLTKLTLVDHHFDLHLDVLLNFLEESHSLNSAYLWIGFAEPSLRRFRRQAPIRNQLRHLSISCNDIVDGRALISSIALQRGAALQVTYYGGNTATLADLLPGLSTMHLPNLSSPVFMEYRSPSELPMNVRLLGPGGSFTLSGRLRLGDAPGLPFPFILNSIREFRLEHRTLSISKKIHLSLFPSLEVFCVSNNTSVSRVLSTLLPKPTSSRKLRTLAFLNCIIAEGFMDELAQFASSRKNTKSASLHRVVVVGSDERLPSVASIERLRKHVPVVEVTEGYKLSMNLL